MQLPGHIYSKKLGRFSGLWPLVLESKTQHEKVTLLKNRYTSLQNLGWGHTYTCYCYPSVKLYPFFPSSTCLLRLGIARMTHLDKSNASCCKLKTARVYVCTEVSKPVELVLLHCLDEEEQVISKEQCMYDRPGIL